MHKGSKEISCAEGATITVRTSGPFCVYGMEQKKRSLILGPVNANERILRYKLPPDIGRVYIKTEKSTEWTIEWSFFTRSEHLDATPIEMPIGYQKPESLADQMRRFIKTEVSKSAQENDLGTFTQEDDFELDEEILTPYEMTDMQEVEEPWDEKIKPDIPDEKEEPKGDEEPSETVAKKEVAVDNEDS